MIRDRPTRAAGLAALLLIAGAAVSHAAGVDLSVLLPPADDPLGRRVFDVRPGTRLADLAAALRDAPVHHLAITVDGVTRRRSRDDESGTLRVVAKRLRDIEVRFWSSEGPVRALSVDAHTSYGMFGGGTTIRLTLRAEAPDGAGRFELEARPRICRLVRPDGETVVGPTLGDLRLREPRLVGAALEHLATFGIADGRSLRCFAPRFVAFALAADEPDPAVRARLRPHLAWLVRGDYQQRTEARERLAKLASDPDVLADLARRRDAARTAEERSRLDAILAEATGDAALAIAARDDPKWLRRVATWGATPETRAAARRLLRLKEGQ